MGLVRSGRFFSVVLAVALLCGGSAVFAATGGFKSAASTSSASNSQYGRSSPKPQPRRTCSRPSTVQRLVFSKASYPNIRAHYRRAVGRGWPRILVLNRPGADARRDRLLTNYPTKRGYDRDEYPPALGRGRGKGLTRGRNPVGWRADVQYVASHEKRSHDSSMRSDLRPFCNGTRFRYVFH